MPVRPDDPIAPTASLCEAFQRTARERPDDIALRSSDGATALTWAQSAAAVERLAGGLASLGVGADDTVALLMRNRPEFNLVDTAAMHLGAIPWSIYPTSSPEQIAFMVSGVRTRVVVCDREFLAHLRDALKGTQVTHVVPADELDALPAPSTGFDFTATWQAIRPESPLNIIWTSGTTGDPKPVELSHGAMTSMLRSLTALAGLPRGGRTVSYLPSAHVADRWMSHYWWMALGMEVTCLAEGGRILEVLPQVRPTFWGSVPRVWEKLRAALMAEGIDDPRALDAEAAAAVRGRIGLDAAHFLIAGAAPLPAESLQFFNDLGLPLSEVWGLSETCGMLTVNPPGDRRVGSVGTPLAGVEIRLTEDGEVLARAPQLMHGYRNRPDLTAETVVDGWLRTGDLGRIDDGYLTITGRKKDIIINTAGRNMSPVAIEAALKTAGPLIGQACVIGDGRPHNVALLVVDPDSARAWATAHGEPEASYLRTVTDERLLKAVQAEVEAANQRLARVEQVRAWQVLEHDWITDSDELTPTMKLRRSRIAEKYADVVTRLYA